MQECEESQTYASFSSAERAKVAEHATCATSAKRVEVPLRNMPNRLTVANSALTMHASVRSAERAKVAENANCATSAKRAEVPLKKHGQHIDSS